MSNEITPYGLTDADHDTALQSATDFHVYMNEHISGGIKKITDAIHESVHDYVINMMESDTKYNFADLVRNRVNYILKGLLSGGWDEATAKKWLEGYDFDKYRKNIYIANQDIIQNKLIDDLLKENKQLTESLEFARKHY